MTQKKDKFLKVRVNQELLDRIDEFAAAHRRTRSDAVRLLLEMVSTDTITMFDQVPTIKKKIRELNDE